jgi:betaine-homocysteine S-methyltransferase
LSSGADIVGINCHFDPFVCLKAVKNMKEGLDAAGLKAHLMIQPLAYHTPDCGKQGFIDLPEFPFGKFLCVSSVHVYVQSSIKYADTGPYKAS